MDTNELTRIRPEGDDLFDRVVSILEQARANVVRSVNNNMVIAYWLIGREIVQEIQGGDERAEYGKQVIEQLSANLTHKYGRGFSTTNLRYFGLFQPCSRDSPHRMWRIQSVRETPHSKWRFGYHGVSGQRSWRRARVLTQFGLVTLSSLDECRKPE
jgi:hypothetical protein